MVGEGVSSSCSTLWVESISRCTRLPNLHRLNSSALPKSQPNLLFAYRINGWAASFNIKDTGAWLLASLPSGLVLNRESSCRQAVFTSRKGVTSSRVVGIETKVRAFLIQSYLSKIPLVSGPVARGGVGHKPLGKHVLSMECGLIYFFSRNPSHPTRLEHIFQIFPSALKSKCVYSI